MLILSRKIDEEIVIEGPAVVKLVGISGGKAKIGIIAERDVSVYRGELPQPRVIEKSEKTVDSTH